MDLAVAATAFALIFPVELPDKTFVASLVLATRYRPLPVWIGVSAAFFVQTVVAVTAGSLLSLLPSEREAMTPAPMSAPPISPAVAVARGLIFFPSATMVG